MSFKAARMSNDKNDNCDVPFGHWGRSYRQTFEVYWNICEQNRKITTNFTCLAIIPYPFARIN